MAIVITILIATSVFNSIASFSASISSNTSSSDTRKSFPRFDPLKSHQKPNLTLFTDSKKDNSSEHRYSNERRQLAIYSQIPDLSSSRTVSRVDEFENGPLSKSSFIADSTQRPSSDRIPAWLKHRTVPRIDHLEANQQSQTAESRQRPSTGQIPSWSNPPNVPWIDDPPSRDGLSLLPILYLLAPLVVTAMLMPIGATLITAVVMMKAQHQAAQGKLKSLFLEDESIAPVYKLFEKNVQDLWKKFEEAIAKYNHGDMENHRKS
ncbi:hypothetical protein HNY73_017512 [Argiope bruennichi]|uniref:Uncharacterized protein n=1 Tax=Argiope bruennichi TaxID=94029 RepID=A0A8T0EAY0_ARGBR|nr:hypothetical protein HNY73_017512 [Argiope bruennichi]